METALQFTTDNLINCVHTEIRLWDATINESLSLLSDNHWLNQLRQFFKGRDVHSKVMHPSMIIAMAKSRSTVATC